MRAWLRHAHLLIPIAHLYATFTLLESTALLLGLALLAVALLFRFQEAVLYRPSTHDPSENPHGYRNPADKGMKYELVTMTAEDGVKLKSWYIARRKRSRGEDDSKEVTIVVFHGNAGTIGHLNDIYFGFSQFANVLAVEYRGYSFNCEEGIYPSEGGLKSDGLAAIDWLLAESARREVSADIFLFGNSLGAAVAIHVADSRPGVVRGLILENGFSSVREIALDHFPILRLFQWLLRPPALRNVFDNAAMIARMSPLPHVLVVSANRDEIIPPHHSRRLLEAAKANACNRGEGAVVIKLVNFEGGHNDIFYACGESYFREIRDFVTSTRAPRLGSMQHS